MYSHGSSARAGVGKRGHGGRNYRPPRPRRDPNTTPPPLKECSCLLQFHLDEYAAPAPRRDHTCFGGREALQHLESQLRSQCLCHLVVPGRKQSGPVAIVGRTIQEALPASAWLMSHLRLSTNDDYVRGQIQSNVKNPRDVPIEGHWCIIRSSEQGRVEMDEDDYLIEPCWLFQSSQWNVMVCPVRFDGDMNATTSNENLTIEPSAGSTTAVDDTDKSVDDADSSSSPVPLLSTLKACVDNVLFRLGGNLQKIHYFVHEYPPMALALGHPEPAAVLLDEIRQSLRDDVERP